MIVGVYGTWRAVEGDPLYVRAVAFGKSIASAGHRVLTGGYSGVMEAVSRGAVQCHGGTIGVTCPETDRLLTVNPWVTERIRAVDLQERLAICSRLADACVFFPGRSGTATELSLALELRDKGTLRYPVILSCEYWLAYLSAYCDTQQRLGYATTTARTDVLWTICAEADAVVGLLEEAS